MNGIEKLRIRMGADGNSLQQDKINSAILYINNTFQDDPAYRIDGVQIDGGSKIYPRIWNYKKEDNFSPTVEIQTQLTDEFKRGQLLIVDGEYWLCLKSQCFHDIYWTGKLKLCTHLLYYQDEKTKNIESSWAVLERPYSKTLNDGQIITTSEMEFEARLPLNDSTKRINLDRRLLIGTEYGKNGNEIGSVYKVIGRDAGSQVINGEGFLVLIMEQVLFSKDKDNIALMIADYIAPDSPAPPIDLGPTLLKCEIAGSPVIKVGGSVRTYKPLFYFADEITLNDAIESVWTVSAPPEYADKIISTSNGNSISLKCTDDNNLIGVKFKLKLADADQIYNNSEIEVEVIANI